MGQLLHTPVNATLECLTPFHVARVVCSRRETKHRTNDRTSRNNTLASRCQISSRPLTPAHKPSAPSRDAVTPALPFARCHAHVALHTHTIPSVHPLPQVSALFSLPAGIFPPLFLFFRTRHLSVLVGTRDPPSPLLRRCRPWLGIAHRCERSLLHGAHCGSSLGGVCQADGLFNEL